MQSDRLGARGVDELTEGRHRRAEPVHRRQPFDDHPGGRFDASEAVEVGAAGDGVHESPVGQERQCGVDARPVRLHHEHVAVEGRQRRGRLDVGADRDGRHPHALRFTTQQAGAETVAVALDDRHDPGVPRERLGVA